MPPSPSLRASPGKETHKRGRSLEHGFSHNKSRDDDLALFNAMQDSERERESFLLQSSDDFDESLNKLRYFSEIKPVNIPARGETSDLLNAEGDKNDYDWLLTPPDTPLFPSLDDEEEPPPLKVVTRGRTQSQTKSLSRSSTIERTTQRSSRSSASPSRHSPSPRSSISTVNSTATLMATRRLSSPPSKPATRRSASPASRRISTPPPSKRGISPVKTASPKLWQVNPPGFPSETPANLKTSIPDRPRPRRQSMSPTPSRSASSSHSHDRFSSHSKASSGDDDVDSMNSVPTGFNNSSGKKSVGMIKNRTVAVSKKPVKNATTVGSAPKRSFDSALWLMDHRKAPQNMFRPLLSSVPTTSFVAGKSSNMIHNRPVVSRNSSLTTSSNASSDHGVVDQVDYFESEKMEGSDLQEEVFMFDKVDELNENENENHDEGLIEKVLEGSRTEMVEVTCSRCRKKFLVMEMDGDVDLCEECVEILNEERVKLVISARNNEDVYENEVLNLNEERAKLVILTRNNEDVCESEVLSFRPDFESKEENEERNELMRYESERSILERDGEKLIKSLDLDITNDSNEAMVSEIDSKDNFEIEIEIKPEIEIQKRTSLDSNLENHNKEIITPSLNSENKSHETEPNKTTPIPKMESTEGADISVLLQQKSSSNKYPVAENKPHETESNTTLIPKMENSEGAGISVLLLQKSSSNKYPVIENKSLFTTTNVQVSEPYYTRDNTSVLKRSFGHQSSSASSSMDLGPFRSTDTKLKRLLSNKTKTPSHKSTGSVSDMSISGSSVRNDEVLYNSFDAEDNNNNIINNNKVVKIMSPAVRERNTNILEPSIEETQVLKSENMSEKISENIDYVDIKNGAESKRVSVDEISSPMESSIVEVSNDNNHESKVPTGARRREMRRSFTLEEATDTILFCSSIIHDLAYKAASIAIDKDDSTPEAPPRPTVTIVEKAPPKEDNLPKAPVKRIVNARKVKRKRPDVESTVQESEMSENIKESDVAIEENNNSNNNNDSRKPAQPPTPKLEAKCNCIIM